MCKLVLKSNVDGCYIGKIYTINLKKVIGDEGERIPVEPGIFLLAYSLVSSLAEVCPSLFKVYLLQDIAGNSLNPTHYISLQFVLCVTTLCP